MSIRHHLFYIWLFLASTASAEVVSWIGYALDSTFAEATQPLGQISLTSFENKTVKGQLSSWTPPKLLSSQHVHIGILADYPRSLRITSSMFSVSAEILNSEVLTLNVYVDEEQMHVWAVGINVANIGAGRANPGRSAGTPKLIVVPESYPPKPHVNKPVVLSKEGKVEEPPPEKTFLQKYWWIMLAITFILMSGGGGDGK